MDGGTLRIETIHPDVWPLLKPLYSDELGGLPIPDEVESSIVGVFDGTKLAAFGEVDMPVHLGPVYVFPEYRGSGALNLLIRHVEEATTRAGRNGYVIISDPRVAKIAKRRGLVPLDGDLYWRHKNGRK